MASRIYVGNLPMDIRERDLDDLFYKYGRIRDIDIKRPSRPPAYAFVAFDDYRDAEDAIRGRDGYRYDGERLRVEPAGERRPGGMGGGGGGRGGYGDDRYQRGGGKRTDFRLTVTNLPERTSWQDLKDYFRPIGDVGFTDVDPRSGEGVVEFMYKEDMKKAVKKLDGTTMKNPFDSREIRVKYPRDSRYADESRSRSRSRSRGSRGGGRSASRSRSRSRGKDRRGSPSRSRSRGSRGRSPSPNKMDEGNGHGNEGDKRRSPSRSRSPEPAAGSGDKGGESD